MLEGNYNTKFLHNYINFSKSVNTVCKIDLQNGSKAKTFEDRAKARNTFEICSRNIKFSHSKSIEGGMVFKLKDE